MHGASLASRLKTGSHYWNPLQAKVNDRKPVSTDKQLFRGFIGGSAFITQTGNRGLEIDSSWSKNIIFSFDLDDVELALHGLKSSLADMQEVVIDGVDGAPFSIGDYGFYTEAQFEEQAKVLQGIERENARNRKQYFSEGEWKEIDKQILLIAQHGKPTFKTATRGDTFCALAIRKNAFQVCAQFLSMGVDPLVENEEGHDLFDICREQYLDLSLQLKALNVRHHEYFKGERRRTIFESIEANYRQMSEQFEGLSRFATTMKDSYNARLDLIELDYKFARRCELLNEHLSEEKAWNIAQKDKLQRHLEEIDSLISYTRQKAEQAVSSLVDFKYKLLTHQTLRKIGSKVSTTTSASQTLEKANELSGSHSDNEESFSSGKLEVLAVHNDDEVANADDDKHSQAESNGSKSKNSQKYSPILGTLMQNEREVIMYR